MLTTEDYVSAVSDLRADLGYGKDAESGDLQMRIINARGELSRQWKAWLAQTYAPSLSASATDLILFKSFDDYVHYAHIQGLEQQVEKAYEQNAAFAVNVIRAND